MDYEYEIEYEYDFSILVFRLHIILKVAKSELMIIGSRQRLNAQCEEINISIDDRTIRRVDHTKSLGLTIDTQLSWSKHVDKISKKVSSAIGALKRVRPFFRRVLQFKFIML